MQNQYNRQPPQQGSNYYNPQYGPPQGSGQPNQMSNYQPGQPPYNQQGQTPYNQQGQPPYNPQGPPPYGPPGQQSYGPQGQPPYNPQGQPSYGPQGQPPYNPQGQPPYGPPGQQSYGPGPQQDPNLTDIPSFRLISRGRGIDQKEYFEITHAANDALRLKEDPLSNGIIKRIKNSLGGEWMAFASVEGLKGYDFSLSIVTGNDFLSFTIENFRFQVCRLRD